MKLRLALAVALAVPAAAHADTITVTTDADAGAGSLRVAITKASNNDTIDVGARQIVLTSGEIDLGALTGLTIQGAGPGQTAVSGNHASRIFTGTGDVTLRDLTLQDGSATGQGGAVMTHGATTSNVVFSGNSAKGTGGALATNTLPVTIDRTLFTDNHATSDGGALKIDTNGTVAITNTTFAGNSSGDGGGGGGFAALSGMSTITLTNDTFANNQSGQPGEAFRAAAQETVHYRNSVFAGNGDICHSFPGGQIISDGHNVFDGTPDASCGVTDADQVVADAKLGALAANGGPSMTLLPADGSPVLDAGDASVCPEVDQRGFTRPETCDVGATERWSPDATTFPLVGSPSTLANLAGLYDGHGRSPTTSFEWGTSTAYGTTTPAVVQATANGTANASITTLAPGVTYHYRFVVSTSDGLTTGADEHFITPDVPHTVLHCKVPSVRKWKRATAKAKVIAGACTPQITRAYSSTIAKGRVIKVVPGHGTILGQYATVTLVISKGKKPHHHHKKKRHRH